MVDGDILPRSANNAVSVQQLTLEGVRIWTRAVVALVRIEGLHMRAVRIGRFHGVAHFDVVEKCAVVCRKKFVLTSWSRGVEVEVGFWCCSEVAPLSKVEGHLVMVTWSIVNLYDRTSAALLWAKARTQSKTNEYNDIRDVV